MQEGEKPAEDPNALLAELESCLNELENLIAKINITNAQSKINGVSITQMLAKKSVFQSRSRYLTSLSARHRL